MFANKAKHMEALKQVSAILCVCGLSFLLSCVGI
jgi:hypothetical protein